MYFATLHERFSGVKQRLLMLQSGHLKFLTIIIILLTIPVTMFLISRQSDLRSRADFHPSLEAESGVLAANTLIGEDPQASAGKYIQFGSTTQPTQQPSSTSFQPTAPYYATFFYLWYKNPSTDGSWSYWPDHSKNPPTTWFSHYLPDPNPSQFDPATELYSSHNYDTFKWQASKLKEAKQEVAIASWWGQNRKEDAALTKILHDFMKRSDNPYPNLRWAIYYEQEGFGDPSVTTLVNDLTYIKNNLANSPYFLRISNKPVIFVYANSADEPGTLLTRWQQANSQLNNEFYYVLKVFSGYATASPQPSSWHQYAPAGRSSQHGSYSFMVSPGFWLDDGSAERLPRNAGEFENAVKAMVASNVTWKLTETWNEWGEGTSVEPGEQVQTIDGKDVSHSSGYPFKNLYVDILNRNLPSLEISQ